MSQLINNRRGAPCRLSALTKASSIMKKRFLLQWVLIVVALALPRTSASAQTDIGGEDLSLLTYEEDPDVVNKMAVADNGWIFVLSLAEVGGENKLTYLRSQDEGKSFETIQTVSLDASMFGTLEDCDFVVTGSTQKDIRLWVALLVDLPGGKSEVSVLKCNANADLTSLEFVYKEQYSTVELYHVAMDTDARCPASDGHPYVIAFALTGYDKASNAQHSFLDYIYSVDGGETFQKRQLYTKAGKESLDGVDLAIGSSKGLPYGDKALMGIVTKITEPGNRTAKIALFCNYANYDESIEWSQPLTIVGVSDEDALGEPKIQMMCDELPYMVGEQASMNFVIVYPWKKDSSDECAIFYAAPTRPFTLTNDEALLPVQLKQTEDNNARQPVLQYDKKTHSYVLTYVAWESGDLKPDLLMHLRGQFSDVGQQDFWGASKCYAVVPSSCEDLHVDVEPKEGRAYWLWMDEKSDNTETVWFDAEQTAPTAIASPYSAQGMRLASTGEYLQVSLPLEGCYRVVLYNLEGEIVMQTTFSGVDGKLSIAGLASGAYLLRVEGKDARYLGKFIVE